MLSTSVLSIYSIQDVLRLGDEARINTPGTAFGNWTWRFDQSQFDDGIATGLAHLTETYGRIPVVEEEPHEADPYDYTAPDTQHPLCF
jgi:4-alpha-glucanotransferase